MRELWAKIDKFLLGRKWSIKDKLTHAVLLHSLVTLLTLGGILLYGVSKAETVINEMGMKLVMKYHRDSLDLLLNERKAELLHDAVVTAENTDHQLDDLEREVRRIVQAMEKIERHPELYRPQHVGLPGESDPYGDIPFYLQHGPEVSPEDFAYEIGMAANMRDILARIADDSNSPFIVCSFIASKHNYSLSADSELLPEIKPSLYFDVVSTDWYQEAVAQGGVVFSDIEELSDASQGSIFFCAIPYRDAEGDIAGVAGVEATGRPLQRILKEVDSWHTTAFGFLLDKHGQVILGSDNEPIIRELALYSGKDQQDPEHADIADMIRAMTEGKQGVSEIMLNGEKYDVGYVPLQHNGWSVGLATAESEVLAPVVRNQENFTNLTTRYVATSEQLEREMAIFFLIVSAVVVCLVVAFGKILAGHFVRPINELADGARTIAAGNLDKKLDIHTGDEIEHLATCFNVMTDELKEHMRNVARTAAEKERLSAELSMAKEIQMSTLPRRFPPFPGHDGFGIYASLKTATEVGGDFYDFCLLDEDHLFFTVADVSGKGMAAALFMVISKTVLKNLVHTMGTDHDLAAVISHTNDQLCIENDAEMFVTAFAGLLELSTGRLTYVNAGHNPPLVYHADEKKFKYLDMERNFVLASMEGYGYKSQELTLVPGDWLFLYTDGLTEARAEPRELYGEQRLRDTLDRQKMDDVTPEGLISHVGESLEEFVGKAEQFDDITMMAISYCGKEEKEGKKKEDR